MSTASEKPKNESIFPATELTTLALRWKELVAAGREDEALEVLNEIVIGSTPMFERLAQFEGYHHTVDLPILVASAQQKVIRWLIHWKPKKGGLFSWFSKCAKNAFRSEVAKASQLRKRFHSFDDTPEKLIGAYDTDVDRHAMSAEVHNRIREITSRWGSKRELGVLQYILLVFEETQEQSFDKDAVLRGVHYAYGISPELAKFFYNWALIAMRDALYEKVNIRLTEQDLFRSTFSYTFLPDFLDIITWDQLKQILGRMGGQRTRWPTLDQLEKERKKYELFLELERTDMDPESFAKVARKHRKSEKSAQEIFDEMTRVVDPRRTGEYDVFGHDNETVGHGHY